jgi:hypothetical protein
LNIVAKPSEQFKQNLEGNDIAQALKVALSEAIELKITTWVSDANAIGEQTQARPGNAMKTRINIVDGDIETEIGSNFLGDGPYSDLREFHLTQVQEGRTIIRQNLESLQQLFGILVGANQHFEAQPVDAVAIPPSSLPPSGELLPPSEELL